MAITLCGSIKFFDDMDAHRKILEDVGHTVFMPVKAPDVDYWESDGTKRVAAKRGLRLIEKHLEKIEQSDAILVVNITKGDQVNYIGANTFMEILFARYKTKKIFILNPLPDQSYIREELDSVEPIVLNGDFALLRS